MYWQILNSFTVKNLPAVSLGNVACISIFHFLNLPSIKEKLSSNVA